MELYHGSENIIEKPQFGKGKSTNDFGRGFYCTESAELACEWACKNGSTEAYVNKYYLDTTGLSIFDLSAPEYNVINWLAVLVHNREVFSQFSGASESKRYLLDEFLPDYSSADVMIGYRADDSYFSIARAFLQNAIPVSKLNRALRLGNLGRQVVLMSRAAFDGTLCLGYGPVNYGEYLDKKTRRDADARLAFRNITSETAAPDDIFMIDILRQKINNTDARLF